MDAAAGCGVSTATTVATTLEVTAATTAATGQFWKYEFRKTRLVGPTGYCASRKDLVRMGNIGGSFDPRRGSAFKGSY